MILRVLIVEDTEERQQILTALYRAHAWVLVNTAQRAITLLQAYDFDLISLDYNLRGQATGASIAQSLAQSRNRNARIIIHSMNPQGAASMLQLLPGAVCYPVNRIARSNKVFKTIRDNIDRLGRDYEWTE